MQVLYIYVATTVLVIFLLYVVIRLERTARQMNELSSKFGDFSRDMSLPALRFQEDIKKIEELLDVFGQNTTILTGALQKYVEALEKLLNHENNETSWAVVGVRKLIADEKNLKEELARFKKLAGHRVLSQAAEQLPTEQGQQTESTVAQVGKVLHWFEQYQSAMSKFQELTGQIELLKKQISNLPDNEKIQKEQDALSKLSKLFGNPAAADVLNNAIESLLWKNRVQEAQEKLLKKEDKSPSGRVPVYPAQPSLQQPNETFIAPDNNRGDTGSITYVGMLDSMSKANKEERPTVQQTLWSAFLLWFRNWGKPMERRRTERKAASLSNKEDFQKTTKMKMEENPQPVSHYSVHTTTNLGVAGELNTNGDFVSQELATNEDTGLEYPEPQEEETGGTTLLKESIEFEDKKTDEDGGDKAPS